MAHRKQIVIRLCIPCLIVLLSLACDSPLLQPNSGIPTQTLAPTPECGGNISGTWLGTAGEYTYKMVLHQTGCTVTGSSSTDGSTGSTINGTVDQGVFHFTESGSEPGACYWTGNLTIRWPGNEMIGTVTNCSKPEISLHK